MHSARGVVNVCRHNHANCRQRECILDGHAKNREEWGITSGPGRELHKGKGHGSGGAHGSQGRAPVLNHGGHEALVAHRIQAVGLALIWEGGEGVRRGRRGGVRGVGRVRVGVQVAQPGAAGGRAAAHWHSHQRMPRLGLRSSGASMLLYSTLPLVGEQPRLGALICSSLPSAATAGSAEAARCAGERAGSACAQRARDAGDIQAASEGVGGAGGKRGGGGRRQCAAESNESGQGEGGADGRGRCCCCCRARDAR